ncbi:MAG: hypothetical protein QM764_06210 [Chitinophagaceae bacterium]
MKRFFQIFSHKYASVICVLFALLNRTGFAIFASKIGRDEQLQLTMTHNLLAGRGFALIKYFSTDLSTPVKDYTLHFPPGFSMAVIPLLKVFNNNQFAACAAFDVLAGIFFVLIIRSLCKKLQFPLYFTNIITVVAGVVQHLIFLESASSDMLSLDFILGGMVISIGVIENSRKRNYLNIAGYGLVFFMPAFLRYMYIPFAPFFPALIFLAGIVRKNNRIRSTGLWLTLTTVGYLLLLLLWMKAVPSELILPTERGFFPSQLFSLSWPPFFVASFINIDFVAMRMQNFFNVFYGISYYSLLFCNIFLLPLFLVTTRFFYRVKKFSFFLVAGWATSWLIIIELAFLTVTNKPQVSPYGSWNYIDEGRYYAFVNVFLLLFVFMLASLQSVSKNLFIKIFLVVSLTLISVETLHGIYFNAKLPFRYREMRSILARGEYAQKYFESLLKKVKEENDGRDIFVVSPDSYYVNYAATKEIKSIYDPLKLNERAIQPSQKSILLFVVDKLYKDQYQNYIEKKNPRLLQVVGDTYFYEEELVPGKIE